MQTLELIGEMTPKNCGPLETLIGITNDDLTLRIDSPGGRVDCGIRLAIALTRWAESHPTNTLTLEVGAMACSMAANLLALAPERAEITGYAASSVMFHSCRGVAEGTPADIIASAQWMGGINEQVIAGLSRRTGRPEKEFEPWFGQSEHWLTGQEALDLGLFGGLASGAAAIKPESLVALYKMAATAANKEETTVEELNKPCAEETLEEEVKEEVIEEQIEKAPEEVVEETKIEEKPESEETIEEIIAGLKEKVAELTEEVEALKAAKASLTGGLRLRKDAPRAVRENWAELVKTIPTAMAPREYAARYEALKKEHPAAFAAYMRAHSTVPTFERNK